MKHATCERCGQTFPMNDVFAVLGHMLCEGCGNEFLAARTDPLPAGAVVPQVDPTVCRLCQADGGERELPRVAGLPACDACEHHLRHRPFPAWVKFSFAGLLALAVLSFFLNLRFFQGYVEIRRAGRASRRGDIAAAASLMTAAARHLPEQPELAEIAALFTGIELMAQDKSAEAVAVLKGPWPRLSGDLRPMAEEALLRAEAGAAFDAKDYDTFLAKEKELLKRNPGSGMAMAAVASAHACKYAVSGLESHKQEAMKLLESASRQSQDPEFPQYRQRILHRLHTREIITRKEFEQRFPQGWSPEAPK